MRASCDVPRIVIAGVSSGVGKTTATVGIIRALQARGMTVAAFKCGPDYLDPSYHRLASGRPCHNLDGWMMGRDAVLDTFARGAAGADIAVIEGVMGLFDGASPTGDAGSTGEIAKWLDAPVCLVADAGGMARSIAALARGFADFDPAVRVAGLVCNRVGSRGHLELLERAVASPPVLGGFPKSPAHAFPSRHLGLHAAEHVLTEGLLQAWADLTEAWIDLDRLCGLARAAPPLLIPAPIAGAAGAAGAARCRIGLAWDDAFHFYYPHNLALLEQAGAELVRFSPLRDARLPAVDGVYIGGGYPELHAAALSANASMRASVAALAASGRPLYAECGGLMYLTRAIVASEQRHAMVGVIPAEAVLCDTRRALGYVEVELQRASVLGPAGARFRGHQFRYSELRDVPDELARLYSVRKRRGNAVSREGYSVGNVVASYVHAHWASNPLIATRWVEACAAETENRLASGE